MTTLLLWIAVAALVLALLVLAAWAFRTANRLDRLHVRCDLSWQALDAALARRAVVARAIAADSYSANSYSADSYSADSYSADSYSADPDSRQLAALADAAERAPRATREGCENELSTALTTLDPDDVPAALMTELGEAESRVLLARRFHNDAVRDTLALREQRAVRWLRLGGHAPRPTYFEIAEPAQR